MIKEAFTEIDDCSYYSSIYLKEDNLNKNNIFINENYNLKIKIKKMKIFLKKEKNYLIM